MPKRFLPHDAPTALSFKNGYDCPLISKSRIYRIYQIAARRQTCHRRWRIVDMQAKAKPEAQIGDHEAKAVSLGDGRLWQSPPNPSSILSNLFNLLGLEHLSTPNQATFPFGHAPRRTIFAKAVFSSLNEKSVVHFVQFVAKKFAKSVFITNFAPLFIYIYYFLRAHL